MINRTHKLNNSVPHVFNCELTDTFGGMPNYSWVQRETVTMTRDYTDRQLIKAVKASLGLTGTRCKVENYGDSITLHVVGACMVAFANFSDE